MKTEFIRYGLKKQRVTVGILQLLAMLGIGFGLFFSPVLIGCSSLGLFILMTAGFIVRLKIRDSLLLSLPSLLYALLSLYLAYYFLWP